MMFSPFLPALNADLLASDIIASHQLTQEETLAHLTAVRMFSTLKCFALLTFPAPHVEPSLMGCCETN